LRPLRYIPGDSVVTADAMKRWSEARERLLADADASIDLVSEAA
jgi:hypothetical protein